MAQTPTQLNQLSDELLSERVSAVLEALETSSAHHLPPVAPFMTSNVMLRLHNLIVSCRLGDRRPLPCSKQAMLAMVVASFTGVKMKQECAEHIGNAQDSFLRHFVASLRKAKHALASAAHKARKAGRAMSAHNEDRVRALEEQVFRCVFGGVPRNVLFLEQSQQSPSSGMPIHSQPVPLRRVVFADVTNLQLKRQLGESIDLARSVERDCSHDVARIAACAERERELHVNVQRG